MVADLTPIAGKLASLVRMLSSDKEGEVLGAAAAIIRMLQSASADIHALADLVEKSNSQLNEREMRVLYQAGFEDGVRAAERKQHGNGDFRNVDGLPPWPEIAQWCQRHDDRLRDNERQFVSDMAARTVWREPTEKQQKWLRSIFHRLGGKA